MDGAKSCVAESITYGRRDIRKETHVKTKDEKREIKKY